MRIHLLAVALVGCLLFARPAHAQYTFEFAEGGTFGTSFSVAQGSTITLQVYLAGTNTTGNTNLASSGLTQGGVGLQYASNGPFNIPGAASNNPNIAAAAAFGGPNYNTVVNNGNGSYGTGNTSTATLQTNSFTPAYPTTTDPSGNNAVLLGTFTFTGVTASSGTTFAVVPSGANNVLGNGMEIDSLITSGSATITVTAVPEPGSLILTGLLATGMAGAALRRRRRQPV